MRYVGYFILIVSVIFKNNIRKHSGKTIKFLSYLNSNKMT